jgi:uncharacterized protein (TIGR02145 family)
MKNFIALTFFCALLVACSSNDDSNGGVIQNTFKVKTSSVTNVGHQSAKVFGTFGSSFLTTVSAYGICYSTSANPSISGPHTIESNYDIEKGTFSSDLSLSQNTTYYVKAYATTSGGTFYGDELTFTSLNQLYTNGGGVIDTDGNSYSSIVINGKQWMKENLNVSKYRNGDVIPQVTDIAQWDALTTGAWCYYADDTANGTTYGKLYNWYAVNDPRGLAPIGWHIPTDTEWSSLITFLGGYNVAGPKLKNPVPLWSNLTQGATNQSGFSALPSGYSYLTLTYTPADQPFKRLGEVAYWWSATASSTSTAYSYNIDLGNSATRSSIRNKTGISVRCIKN